MKNDYRNYSDAMLDDEYLAHAWKNHKYLYIDAKGNYVYPKVQKAAKAIKGLYTKALISTKLRKLKEKVRRKLNLAKTKVDATVAGVKGYAMLKKAANKTNAAKRAKDKAFNASLKAQKKNIQNGTKSSLKTAGNYWKNAQKTSAQKKKERDAAYKRVGTKLAINGAKNYINNTVEEKKRKKKLNAKLKSLGLK